MSCKLVLLLAIFFAISDLIEIADSSKHLLDEKHYVIGVTIDRKKAYDPVDHIKKIGLLWHSRACTFFHQVKSDK